MSKELEALETLKLLKDFVLKNNKNGLDRRFIIGSCDILEKELKALEIIKEKRVGVSSLLSSIEWHNPSHYNDSIGCPIGYELTQEEYDLLKEVLTNE